jgi:hypothetical protein
VAASVRPDREQCTILVYDLRGQDLIVRVLSELQKGLSAKQVVAEFYESEVEDAKHAVLVRKVSVPPKGPAAQQ